MLLPQLMVVLLLTQWGLTPFALAVSVVVVAQLLAMRKLLRDPKQFAPWYNATGVSLYVLGMMAAAVGLGGWLV
jgi:chlorophyll synthase